MVTLVAFALGVAIGWAPLHDGTVPLRTTDQYPIWVLLVAVVCAACPSVWGQGVRNVEALSAPHSLRREAVTYAGCAAALVLVILLVPTALPAHRAPRELLPYLGARLLLLYLAVAVAAGPGVIAVSRVGAACRRADGDLPDLIKWRAVLDAQLWSFGGLVVLATVTTSALRNAALAVPGNDPASLPQTAPVLFGACLTLVVALAHYPSSNAWRQRVQHFLDNAVPLPERLDGDWQAQLRRRHDLTAELGVDATKGPSLQSWLIVGGPLITSALALLLPTP